MASSEKYQRFWLLAALKLDNEATEEELRELEELLRDNEELQIMIDKARQLYHFKAESGQTPDAGWAFSKHMQRLSNRLSRPSVPDEAPLVPPVEMAEGPVRRGYRRI